MKGSIIVLLCFVAGWTAGNLAGVIDGMHSLSVWLLYLLMFQVGLGIGLNPDLGKMLRSLRMTDILLPVVTMAGTLLFTAAGSFLISRWSIAECLAVNSACGYYSLSSILTAQGTDFCHSARHSSASGKHIPRTGRSHRSSSYLSFSWPGIGDFCRRRDLGRCMSAGHT